MIGFYSVPCGAMDICSLDHRLKYQGNPTKISTILEVTLYIYIYIYIYIIIIIYQIYIVPYITCKKVTLRRLTINNSMDVTVLHL